VLATVVATPCSAPFMGTALGYALVQPAAVALAVFTALGLGLAFPYLLLTFVPRLGALLPRPGAVDGNREAASGVPAARNGRLAHVGGERAERSRGRRRHARHARAPRLRRVGRAVRTASPASSRSRR
jgi:hypothetical protein